MKRKRKQSRGKEKRTFWESGNWDLVKKIKRPSLFKNEDFTSSIS